MNPRENQDNIPMDYPNDNYLGAVPNFTSEEDVKNIVAQIDPQRILDNLNHALKGEYYSKEKGGWINIAEPLINDAGRGWIISFFTSIMNNASTMGTITEQQFSYLIEGVINVVTREFRCNLEKFGFVPPSKTYSKGIYENKGTPDTSRMGTISEMIYQRTLIIYSRSIKGSESKRVFGSLKMSDTMGYGGMNQQPQKKNFISRMFGGN